MQRRGAGLRQRANPADPGHEAAPAAGCSATSPPRPDVEYVPEAADALSPSSLGRADEWGALFERVRADLAESWSGAAAGSVSADISNIKGAAGEGAGIGMVFVRGRGPANADGASTRIRAANPRIASAASTFSLGEKASAPTAHSSVAAPQPRSLVLVEDIDIVLDTPSGVGVAGLEQQAAAGSASDGPTPTQLDRHFLVTLREIAVQTRCPIILTANTLPSGLAFAHLAGLPMRVLFFSAPPQEHIAALVTAVLFAERRFLRAGDWQRVRRECGGDVRRTLLQCQALSSACRSDERLSELGDSSGSAAQSASMGTQLATLSPEAQCWSPDLRGAVAAASQRQLQRVYGSATLALNVRAQDAGAGSPFAEGKRLTMPSAAEWPALLCGPGALALSSQPSCAALEICLRQRLAPAANLAVWQSHTLTTADAVLLEQASSMLRDWHGAQPVFQRSNNTSLTIPHAESHQLVATPRVYVLQAAGLPRAYTALECTEGVAEPAPALAADRAGAPPQVDLSRSPAPDRGCAARIFHVSPGLTFLPMPTPPESNACAGEPQESGEHLVLHLAGSNLHVLAPASAQQGVKSGDGQGPDENLAAITVEAWLGCVHVSAARLDILDQSRARLTVPFAAAAELALALSMAPALAVRYPTYPPLPSTAADPLSAPGDGVSSDNGAEGTCSDVSSPANTNDGEGEALVWLLDLALSLDGDEATLRSALQLPGGLAVTLTGQHTADGRSLCRDYSWEPEAETEEAGPDVGPVDDDPGLPASSLPGREADTACAELSALCLSAEAASVVDLLSVGRGQAATRGALRGATAPVPCLPLLSSDVLRAVSLQDDCPVSLGLYATETFALLHPDQRTRPAFGPAKRSLSEFQHAPWSARVLVGSGMRSASGVAGAVLAKRSREGAREGACDFGEFPSVPVDANAALGAGGAWGSLAGLWAPRPSGMEAPSAGWLLCGSERAALRLEGVEGERSPPLADAGFSAVGNLSLTGACGSTIDTGPLALRFQPRRCAAAAMSPIAPDASQWLPCDPFLSDARDATLPNVSSTAPFGDPISLCLQEEMCVLSETAAAAVFDEVARELLKASPGSTAISPEEHGWQRLQQLQCSIRRVRHARSIALSALLLGSRLAPWTSVGAKSLLLTHGSAPAVGSCQGHSEDRAGMCDVVSVLRSATVAACVATAAAGGPLSEAMLSVSRSMELGGHAWGRTVQGRARTGGGSAVQYDIAAGFLQAFAPCLIAPATF